MPVQLKSRPAEIDEAGHPHIAGLLGGLRAKVLLSNVFVSHVGLDRAAEHGILATERECLSFEG